MPNAQYTSASDAQRAGERGALHYLAGYLRQWARFGQPMLPEDIEFALEQAQKIIDDHYDGVYGGLQ